MSYKIVDKNTWSGSATDKLITDSGNRLSIIARHNINLVRSLRKPTIKDITLKKYDKLGIEKFFKAQRIESIEYGRWVTNVDRLTYTFALIAACEDLQKITGFRSGVGFDVLKIAIGSRGIKNTLAHFNSRYFHININRHKRSEKGYFRSTSDVNINYLQTSGIQSLAHEYGHFIDFFAARYIVRSNFASLSRGKKNEYFFEDFELNDKNLLVSSFNKLMCLICFESLEQKFFSNYFDRLMSEKQNAMRQNNNEGLTYLLYLLRPVEIFARYFDAFCFYELKQKKITNLALTKEAKTYSDYIYVDESLYQRTKPYMKTILKEMAKINNDKKLKFTI